MGESIKQGGYSMDKVTKLIHNMQRGSDVERTMQNETIGSKCITRPMTKEEKQRYASIKSREKVRGYKRERKWA